MFTVKSWTWQIFTYVFSQTESVPSAKKYKYVLPYVYKQGKYIDQ